MGYRTIQMIQKNNKFPQMELYGEIYEKVEDAYKEYEELISNNGKSNNWKALIETRYGDECNYLFSYYDSVLAEKLFIEYKLVKIE